MCNSCSIVMILWFSTIFSSDIFTSRVLTIEWEEKIASRVLTEKFPQFLRRAAISSDFRFRIKRKLDRDIQITLIQRDLHYETTWGNRMRLTSKLFKGKKVFRLFKEGHKSNKKLIFRNYQKLNLNLGMVEINTWIKPQYGWNALKPCFI